jgi:hypothetical protein
MRLLSECHILLKPIIMNMRGLEAYEILVFSSLLVYLLVNKAGLVAVLTERPCDILLVRS